MNTTIKIQSFYGIGDLLFITPSFPVIKKAYPDVRIEVNTQYPELLQANPFVDRIGRHRIGTALSYPDPAHGIFPLHHNILSDWTIVCAEYGLITQRPRLQPEIYLPILDHGDTVRVQVLHNNHFHGKRVWPSFHQLVEKYGYEPIEQQKSLKDLVTVVAESRAIICADSGIQHIAKAVGTPAVVVYGGFSKPAWNGYESNVNMVNFKACSPCYNTRPCINTIERACMREITIEQVHEAVEEMLGTLPNRAQKEYC